MANWLQLIETDDEWKSKVRTEEREKTRREKREKGNVGVHKPTGFRWISSEEEIFHSLSLTETSSVGD